MFESVFTSPHQKIFLFIDLREINLSFQLLITHWLSPVWALSGDRTSSLGVSGATLQPTGPPARAPFLRSPVHRDQPRLHVSSYCALTLASSAPQALSSAFPFFFFHDWFFGPVFCCGSFCSRSLALKKFIELTLILTGLPFIIYSHISTFRLNV